MHYHADFWIAIATAAPVVGVALAVTLPALVRSSFRTVLFPEQENASRKRRIWSGVSVVFSLVFAGGEVWALTVLFENSLRSLGDERDATSIDSAITLVIIIFIAVFVYTLLGALYSIVDDGVSEQ